MLVTWYKDQEIELTGDQQAAAQALDTFLAGADNQVFLLKGSAGSGKTFLMEGVVAAAKRLDMPVVAMAPTAIAARMLSQRLRLPARTVHATIFGLDTIHTPDDPDRGDWFFTFGVRANVMPPNALYIVDEASMVGDRLQVDEKLRFGSGKLLTDLLGFVYNPLREGGKMIFLGDPNQLPPVKETESPAMQVATFESRGLKVAEARLTEVVRQKQGSQILQLASTLRQHLEEKTYPYFQPGAMPPDIEAHTVEVLKQSFGPGSPMTLNQRIIAHTNREVNSLNKVVRERIFPDRPDPQPGDWMMVTRNSYLRDTFLINGSLIQVLESNPDTREVRAHHVRTRTGTEEIKLVFQRITFRLAFEDPDEAPSEGLFLYDFLHSPDTQPPSALYQGLMVDFKKRYPKLSPKSEEFKQYLLKDPWFNALHLKYGYAITVHKAQGSEWDTLQLVPHASMDKRTEAYYRWFYTAITRAKRVLQLIVPDPHPGVVFANDTGGALPKISKLNQPTGKERFLPEWPALENEPPGYAQFPFLRVLHNEWQEAARATGAELEVSQLQYKVRYMLTKGGGSLGWDQNYSKEGPTSDLLSSVSSPDLNKWVVAWRSELPLYPLPEMAPGPRRDWFEQWQSALEADGLVVTNHDALSWKDRYYIRTRAASAYIDATYDKSGHYTRFQAASTAGEQDELLRKAFQLIPQPEMA